MGIVPAYSLIVRSRGKFETRQPRHMRPDGERGSNDIRVKRVQGERWARMTFCIKRGSRPVNKESRKGVGNEGEE